MEHNKSWDNQYNRNYRRRSNSDGHFDDQYDDVNYRNNVNRDTYGNYNSDSQSRNNYYSNYGNRSSGNYGENDRPQRRYSSDYNNNMYQNSYYADEFSRNRNELHDEDRSTWNGENWQRGNVGDEYNYGSRYGNSNDDYRYSRARNMYGGDTSNRGNANQGGYDRDWWDRTKDEVSSWFGDDEAERRRRMDRVNTSGPHRGKGPRDYSRSEDRIREDICDRLTDDDRLDASDIQVQVQGTEVILSGTVNDRRDKRRAEDLVESISGVRNVENRIRVNWDSNNLNSGSTDTDAWSSERNRDI